MYLLIVTFRLQGISDRDYRRGCAEEAAVFASIPGLVSKTWLANASTNTYGGVYAFADRDSLVAYLDSDLFRAIGDDPTVVSLSTSAFEVLDEPSRTTRAFATVAVG